MALKLANFARLDPALQGRNISGMSHGSKGEEEIWNEFNSNWEGLAFESERILADYKGSVIENVAEIPEIEELPIGKERESLVKVRVNQPFSEVLFLHHIIINVVLPEYQFQNY